MKIYAGIVLLSMVTIESGGYFLLRILSGKEPGKDHPIGYSLFRAGHAHAGVLTILALVASFYTEQTHLTGLLKNALRGLFFAAPLLIAGGFFGAGAMLKGGRPGPLIAVTFVGAAVLAGALIWLAVALFMA